VQVNAWSPQNLSDDEKNMLEKMRDSQNFAPGPESKDVKEDRSFFDKIKDAFS